MTSFGRKSATSSHVFLNVYDLNQNNEYLYPWGLGMYHSGVEINGTEYTFGSGSGIFNMSPRDTPPGAKFREAIDMGPCPGSKEISRAIEELRPEFKGSDYNLLSKNCNHFAEAFIRILLNKSLPGYVNRLAYMGSFFSCLLPQSLTNGAPVDNGENAYSTSQGGRAATNQGRNNAYRQSTTTPFAGSGFKLGGEDSTKIEDRTPTTTDEHRRDKLRAAALRRMNVQ